MKINDITNNKNINSNVSTNESLRS